MAGAMKRLTLLLGIALFMPTGFAQELTSEQSNVLSEMIAKDKRFQEALKTCPADAFASEKSIWYRWGLKKARDWEACKRDPAGCLKDCQSGLPVACFRTARLLEREAGEPKSLDVQRVFAFGCLAGNRSSCTNRGAGIRNGQLEGDNFLPKPPEVIETCQAALFKRGCGYKTPDPIQGWGCAMLAQAFENGEGVKMDKNEALRLYRGVKAEICSETEDETGDEINTHPACSFAESGIEGLSN